MKQRVLVLTVLFAAFLAAGCSKENEPMPAQLTGFVTGYSGTDGYLATLRDDFGNEYKVTNRINAFVSNTSFRYVVRANLDGNGNASIYQLIDPIAHKAIEDHTLNDTLRVKDPLKIVSAYIGGDHLNIVMQIKTRYEAYYHFLEYTHKIKNGNCYIKFYHNAFNDEPVYTRDAFLSIPLESYNLHQNDTVAVKYPSSDGDRIIKLVYK